MLEGRIARRMRPNAPINSPRGPDMETARLSSLAASSKSSF